MDQNPSSPTPARPRQWLRLDATTAVCVAFFCFMCWWFRIYFSADLIAAVDLPGHLTAIAGLRENFWRLAYTFYDISCFTGYPAFQFYTFLAHWAAAALSFPLAVFSADPVRLSAHVMLVFAMGSMPPLIVWAVKPIVVEIFDGDEEAATQNGWIVAMAACVFSFWFVNHDHQWYGIGAAAVMNIGLFSQGFAWHFMILHFGALCRLLQTGSTRDLRLVVIFFVLVFLVHTMTAVFSFYLAFMAFIWFRDRRGAILKAHLAGFMIVGFWVVPMAAYMSAYTPLDIHRPTGDFLEIMLKYPVAPYLRSMRSWLHGRFELLSLAEPTMFVLLAVAGFHRHAQKSRLLVAFLVFEIFGIAILTSGYVASSFPLGFHYYRFVAYMMIFFTMLMAPVPLVFLKSARNSVFRYQREKLVKVAAVVVFAGGFATIVALPHYERDKVANTRDGKYLATEMKVLEHFKGLPEKGRVLFEYFSDYGKYPFLSCHFMSTRLLATTGFEPINGLFVQSSLAYHFPMGSANQLKANTYNAPLLFPASTDLTDDTKIEQLKEFGVTHVVSGGEEFYNRIKKHAVGEPVVIGHYKIVQIQQHPAPMAMPAYKRVVSYKDLRGNLPYKFIELYFYGKDKLTRNYDVLHTPSIDDVPPQTEVIILNGDPEDVKSTGDKMVDAVVKAGGQAPRIIGLDYEQYYLTKHYAVWYQHNPEIDDYADLTKYLDPHSELKSLGEVGAVGVRPETSSATFEWEQRRQGFAVNGLAPGRLHRINYSHFPYWHSGDGRTWRGSGDRIFFLPSGERAEFNYTKWRSRSTYLGWLLTLLALFWMYRSMRKDRQDARS